MKKRTAVFVGLAVAISLLSFGCGASGTDPLNNVAYQPSNVSTSNTHYCANGFWIADQCAFGATFDQACASLSNMYTGTKAVPVTVNGVRTCKTSRTMMSGFYMNYAVGYLPILSEEYPMGYSTGVNLKANDKLSISASGHWGGQDINTFKILWGFANWTTVTFNCSMYGSLGGPATMNGTIPMGISASDGSEVFSVGTSVSNKVIANDGTLKLGFNVPLNNGYNTFCGSLTVSSVRITRCEDASGNAYLCP
jgi:hypothetical protein